MKNRSKEQSTWDPLMLAYWERVLKGLVNELYFSEKVPAEGLRRLFEALYAGDHPLRIALDKLQTLDTVRIIEGKP